MKYDIIVVGGGLVGASLAVALTNNGLKIALVESREPAPLPGDMSWDSRVYAISPGSAKFLRDMDVWQKLDATRITPVYEMIVLGDDDTSRINFSAYELGLPELAFIVEGRQLQTTAWNALKSVGNNIDIFCPMQCTSITWHTDQAEVRLTDGSILQTMLIVGADGVNSWVRKQASIDVSRYPYQQIGLVANFSAKRSHRNIARQWFRRDGVLALLPLPDKQISMVWSTNEEQANQLRELPEDELCQRVAEASSYTLGELQLVTQPVGFPLNFVHVEKLIAPRLALVGDAAHGIHPLAGQGVNLGLRDSRELVAILRNRGLQTDCGDYRLLRRFERARKEDISTMELVTDGLQKLFNNNNPTLARLRNLGLEITNRLPLLKNRLIQHSLN